MKSKSLLILTIAFFHLSCFAQSQTKFSSQAVKEDLEFLYKTLEATHYDLYASTDKESFEKAYNKIYKSIENPLTLLEANRIFQSFTALAQHGHCSVELPISSYSSYLQHGGNLFPFNVYFSDNRVYIQDNYSNDSSIIRGDEILSLNGKPMKEVLGGIYEYLSGENNYSKNTQIESLSFSRLYWIVYDRCDTFDIKLKKRDGEVSSLKVNAVPAGQFEARAAQKEPPINTNRDFNFIGDIAYLHPGCFYNPQGNGSVKIDNKLLENSEYLQFLDSSFTEIHNRKAKDLIIDLRGNPGGSATFSNPMVAFFATKPFVGGSKLCIKASEVNKNFWKDLNDSYPLFVDIKKEVLAHENGARFEVSLSKYQPRKDSLRFDGNVYVLINRFSFSEAIVISAMMQDYGFGKIIGEETSPVMYANARQFKLPNTQMTVTCPEAYFVRPNGDTALKGTVPDYIVHDNILTDEDEILEYTLNLIKKGDN